MKAPKLIEVHVGRVGGCSRALSFHMVKAKEGPVSERVREIYDEGERIEREMMKELKSKGYSPVKGKQESTLLILDGKKVKLMGTPDFMVRPLKKKVIPLELKSMNRSRFFRLPKRFEDWEDFLKFKYSYQLRGYLALCDSETIIFMAKEKTKKDKSDGRVKEIFVDEDDRGLPTWEDFKIRICRALAVFDGEEVLPEKYEKCEYCVYNHLCVSTILGDKKVIKRKRSSKQVEDEDKLFVEEMGKQHERVVAMREDLRPIQERHEWFVRLYNIKYGTSKKSQESIKGGGV